MSDERFVSPLEFLETQPAAVLPMLAYVARPRVWIDIGCGRGALGKILFERWGVRGVGLEFLPERADEARKSGAYDLVVTGDYADDAAWTRCKRRASELDALYMGKERGWFVISNPPFSQWEIVADRASEIVDGGPDDAAAILLPSMAFEQKRTKSYTNTRRHRHLGAGNVGRYDLGPRCQFGRVFIDEGTKHPYVAVKGTANSTYSWHMKGEIHAGIYRWLGAP